jgi:hypothetical protein
MKRQRKPRWVLETRRTEGYGMVQAVLTRPDGRRFEGWSLTEHQAEYRARLQAGRGCGRGSR